RLLVRRIILQGLAIRLDLLFHAIASPLWKAVLRRLEGIPSTVPPQRDRGAQITADARIRSTSPLALRCIRDPASSRSNQRAASSPRWSTASSLAAIARRRFSPSAR